MVPMNTLRHLSAGALIMALAAAGAAAEAQDPMDRYNVVWTTPSKGESGSMPLGNGDVGVNLWVEEGGDLLLLVSKTDAWDAHGRLLKLGRLRVALTPNPFAAGSPFRQTLRLEQGEVEIVAGPAAQAVTLRVWVDAHRPVVHVEADGAKPIEVRTSVELWRTKEGPLAGHQRDAARGILGAPYPLVVPADTVVDAGADRVAWFHRNVTSAWPVTMKVQGLEGIVKPSDDPLLGRTFGGMVCGGVRDGPTALKSRGPARRHEIAIYALTKAPATQADWLADLGRLAAAESQPLDKARADHRAWWAQFWNRSWIHVSGQTAAGPGITANALPLRIGAGSTGANRFAGDVARPMVFGRALVAAEVAALAARQDEALRKDPALVGFWTFEDRSGDAFAAAGGAGGAGLAAKIVGEVEVVEAPGGKALRLAGKGFLEVADSPALRLANACTLAAWVARSPSSAEDGRILDKSAAGTSNGYLMDTHPGRSLRMIVAPGTLIHKDALPDGQWTHVAATFDAAGGQRLYVNGRCVAERALAADRCTVSQGYALQRFINACGGRGAMPIKFNGSIFTVDPGGADPDYRRWGGCYWWQNTRLPYWSMPVAGDFDLMQPLFKAYRDALPLAKAITRLYFDHDGAYFPETMYFWGTPCNDDFGWERGGNPQSLMINEYIRRLWQGGLELVMMTLDAYDHTQDEALARETLVPLADAVVTFYDKHYPRQIDGRLRIEPAQACETWWTTVNPMPEVAGLRAVLPRLAALPENLATAEQRTRWKRLLGQVPPVPTRKVDDKAILAAADSFARHQNIENPELYAVWPYRLFGVGRENLDLALGAWEHRVYKRTGGWTQDPIQAACLGLAGTAADFTAQNFASHDAGSRFPAFWGPNFDWTPDQCHGGVSMTALQTMLVQCDGPKILVLPAWPKEWDVDFRLHAPFNTTVEGTVRGGKLERLKVTPEARAKDVVRMDPQ